MAIRIKSMNPNMPIIINMDEIPKNTGLNVARWLEIMQDQKIALVRTEENPIHLMDSVEEILNNAERITNFIIDGTTGNKRDNQEVL